MHSARIMLGIVTCSALSLGGCSSSSTTTTGTDAGGGGGGGDAGGAGESVNGCTAADFAANDLSAPSNARKITFPSTATPAQYSPACFTIAVTQSVTWSGDFVSHPLTQAGGDPSTWITTTSTGTTATFGFPVGGTYGFECSNHPSIMKGAVYVK
jgi:plastocyanin